MVILIRCIDVEAHDFHGTVLSSVGNIRLLASGALATRIVTKL